MSWYLHRSKLLWRGSSDTILVTLWRHDVILWRHFIFRFFGHFCTVSKKNGGPIRGPFLHFHKVQVNSFLTSGQWRSLHVFWRFYECFKNKRQNDVILPNLEQNDVRMSVKWRFRPFFFIFSKTSHGNDVLLGISLKTDHFSGFYGRG